MTICIDSKDVRMFEETRDAIIGLLKTEHKYLKKIQHLIDTRKELRDLEKIYKD